MARITARIPSPGTPVDIRVRGLGTAWTTIAEGNDFSLPDPSGQKSPRDPGDDSRYIAPGLLSFERPIMAGNSDTVERWVEFQMLDEAGTTYRLPGRFPVPPGAAVQVPVQALVLLKRTAGGANGDRLQARAEVVSMIDLWGSAEETISSEHEGVI